MGVGGGLRGAAAVVWRRQRVESTRRAVGCGVGEADVGVGGGLRGAAAMESRGRVVRELMKAMEK